LSVRQSNSLASPELLLKLPFYQHLSRRKTNHTNIIMFVKNSASAGLLMALANFAAASPVLMKRDAPAAPANVVLSPAGDSGSNLALATKDHFIWTHEDQGM
jgi:hypothetical protein